jgi:hypothetical protein
LPPFGGLRFAVHPAAFGVRDAKPYESLEALVRAVFTRLEHMSAEPWSRVGEALAADPELRSLSPPSGFVDFHRSEDPDGARHVVARGFIPFRPWPVGGWAVYDGRHFGSSGVTPYTQEELGVIW